MIELLEFSQLTLSKHFPHRIESVRISNIQLVLTALSLSFVALNLSKTDLLSIEQIEFFSLPYTHLYLVTLSPSIQRTNNLLGNISLTLISNGKSLSRSNILTFSFLTFLKETSYHSSFIVKPLDNNILSRLGRTTKKTIAFAIELASANLSAWEYRSQLRIFFATDRHQSILDHSIHVKPSPRITVDVLPLSTRSTRILLRHLCLSYIEVKAIVYHHSVIRH